MEENINVEVEQENQSQLNKVTPLSRYLAMALFIILPFVGFWLGYNYAPEKMVEVERVVIKEVEIEAVSVKDKILHDVVPFASFLGWSFSWNLDGNLLAQNRVTKLTMDFPKDWLITSSSHLETGNANIIFRNPDLLGKPDTDSPSEHVSLSLIADDIGCTEVWEEPTLALNSELSKKPLDTIVYDSGWTEGWALLPYRQLCYDTGENLLMMSFSPLDEAAQDSMNEIINTISIE